LLQFEVRRTKARRCTRRDQLSSRRSGGLQIGGGGLAAAPVGLDVEGDLLTLDQPAHSGALDRRDMNEHIGAAAILHDESEAL
jgi:hypothetical protein